MYGFTGAESNNFSVVYHSLAESIVHSHDLFYVKIDVFSEFDYKVFQKKCKAFQKSFLYGLFVILNKE